jgi:hypothetical protein
MDALPRQPVLLAGPLQEARLVPLPLPLLQPIPSDTEAVFGAPLPPLATVSRVPSQSPEATPEAGQVLGQVAPPPPPPQLSLPSLPAADAYQYPPGTEVPIGGDLRVRVQSARGLPPSSRNMHVYAKVWLALQLYK